MDGRKRRQDGGALNTNGGFKKHKQELDSSVIGSKSKPCTKFFSTSGCPFGENCHFLHHVPGGYKAISQMAKVGPSPPQAPNDAASTPMCKRFSSGEGCRFGDKCHFSHGQPFEDHRHMGPPMHGRYGRLLNESHSLSAGFGESENATVKIGVESSLAGPIIGKGGVNSKQICRQTGVKLSIRDHESNPHLKNIELEGSFDQIKIATAMVRDLVKSLSALAPMKGHVHGRPHGGPAQAHGPASNSYKTKLCENFSKGTCTFGDKCHFAHGASELHKSGI